MEMGERREVSGCSIINFEASPHMQETLWLAVAYIAN